MALTNSGFELTFDESLGLDQGVKLPDPPGNYDPENLHPILRERLGKAHNRYPLWVASGYRSSEEQEILWEKYQAGTGNPANPPGSSNHEAIPYGEAMGLAADIHPEDGSNSYASMQAACVAEGLHFPIATERWHVQPIEVEVGYWNGLPDGF